MAKDKCALKLSIYKPGVMPLRSRKKLAAWVRRQLTHFVKYGARYSDTGWFTARYLYKNKK